MIDTKFKSIIEVMESYIERNLIQTGQSFFNSKDKTFDYISYTDLSSQAFSIGAKLIDRGVEQRNLCMIVCSNPKYQVLYFYACLSINAIPLIIPSPKVLSGNDSLLKKIRYWANNKFSSRTFILVEEANVFEIIASQYSPLKVIKCEEMEYSNLRKERPINHTPSANDIAYFQMTSASTGDGKAVAISHGNIIDNINGIHNAVKCKQSEKVCSWLPLYHDMGLVGAELFSFYHGFDLFLMSPYEFLRKPIRWLETISNNKCTLSPSPNFGFEYASRYINLNRVEDLDLSSWKAGLNGAEPIRSKTLSEFYVKFKRYGFEPNAILPVYGLAEATLAVTFSKVGEKPMYVIVEKGSVKLGTNIVIKSSGVFDPLNPPNINPKSEILSFSVGTAIQGLKVQIIDELQNINNEELMCGEISILGNSIAIGYITAEKKDIESFEKKINTGDLGFIYQGNLYVLERIKNLIIRNGENYLSSDLENYLSTILGLPEANIAVFEEDLFNAESNIIALIEIKPTHDIESICEILQNNEVIDLPINRLILSHKTKIPKTTSGKKRHFLCRELLNNEKIDVVQEIIL
ncbi:MULTISPECIES: AMP-binding protein [Bacillus cereus group]|uniref:AMP-binding protein n=1 Tax=Bacillus cereus group TaxID=86661 RepID=UPI001F5A1A02|nr:MULTISPECIES: AMP-binding protein [Bacillus cereus group]MDH2888289.1 AMP-binding protein [Bacillus cytotoxicus]